MSSQWSFTKGWFEQLQIRGCLHVHMPSLAHAWSFLQRWLVVPGYDCLWLCLCMYVQLSLCAYAFLSPQMMLSSRILCVCICLCSDYIVIGTQQGTINCASLLAGLGGSGNPRRKWEEMGEREMERGSERGGERKVLFLFAKWSKRTIEMQEVYMLPLKKPCLRHTAVWTRIEMCRDFFVKTTLTFFWPNNSSN